MGQDLQRGIGYLSDFQQALNADLRTKLDPEVLMRNPAFSRLVNRRPQFDIKRAALFALSGALLGALFHIGETGTLVAFITFLLMPWLVAGFCAVNAFLMAHFCRSDVFQQMRLTTLSRRQVVTACFAAGFFRLPWFKDMIVGGVLGLLISHLSFLTLRLFDAIPNYWPLIGRQMPLGQSLISALVMVGLMLHFLCRLWAAAGLAVHIGLNRRFTPLTAVAAAALASLLLDAISLPFWLLALTSGPLWPLFRLASAHEAAESFLKRAAGHLEGFIVDQPVA